MRIPSDPCDPNRLRHLLDDRLDEDDQAELAMHLDDCASCRGTLDAMAARSVWWREARRFLGDEADHTRTNTDPRKPEPDAATLDFLATSDNPEHLGRLGPYEVVSVLGRGGMGLVVRGIDSALNRHVAIKILAPQLATSATARRRFAREAQAAAAISHDHIVAIHSVDASGGLPYLVMQLVSGRSLQDRIDQTGALELEEILRIGIQTASGLAAAHAVGLIHRDIKPSNILLENCVERVKITDFGLARAVDDASLTQSGVVAGTPQYMSPEQARGEPADHRADLFSLGSVLYALCTGRAPFRADSTPAVLRRVSEDTPRSIRELNPTVPTWLERIVTKLHAKNPADRYQSATEVADLLSRCLAYVHEPTVVPLPPEIADPPKKRPARHKVMLAAAIALLAICGLGAAEATGVTKVLSTVIRFTTAEGTLKVTVNDPNIKVRVDDKDLVITGAGPEEIRVSPGLHKVVGTRNGKQIEKPVTISRGGVETVEVSFEPADTAPVIEKAEARPATNKPIDDVAAGQLALAQADLNRAADRLEWSRNMFLKGYVSQKQFEADFQSFLKNKVELDAAKRDPFASPAKSEPIAKSPPGSDPFNLDALNRIVNGLKDKLGQITERGSQLSQLVQVPAADRKTIADKLAEVFFLTCDSERLVINIGSRLRKASATDPTLDVAIREFETLEMQFVRLHQELQVVFRHMAALAEKQPKISTVDAFIAAGREIKGGQLPAFESMADTIVRLRTNTTKSMSTLDIALQQLYIVEHEQANQVISQLAAKSAQQGGAKSSAITRIESLKGDLVRLRGLGADLRRFGSRDATVRASLKLSPTAHVEQIVDELDKIERQWLRFRDEWTTAISDDRKPNDKTPLVLWFDGSSNGRNDPNATKIVFDQAAIVQAIKPVELELDRVHREYQIVFDLAANAADAKPGMTIGDAVVEAISGTALNPPRDLTAFSASLGRLKKSTKIPDGLELKISALIQIDVKLIVALQPGAAGDQLADPLVRRDAAQVEASIRGLQFLLSNHQGLANAPINKSACIDCHQAPNARLEDDKGKLLDCPGVKDIEGKLEKSKAELDTASAIYKRAKSVARSGDDKFLINRKAFYEERQKKHQNLLDYYHKLYGPLSKNPDTEKKIDDIQKEIARLQAELKSLQSQAPPQNPKPTEIKPPSPSPLSESRALPGQQPLEEMVTIRSKSASSGAKSRISSLFPEPARSIEIAGEAVLQIAVSPDGKLVAAGCESGDIRIYDLTNGSLKSTLPRVGKILNDSGWACSLQFLPDGKSLVSNFSDANHHDHPVDLEVWDVASARLTHRLKGHTQAVLTLAVSPDGKTLVSGGYGPSVIMWNLDTRTMLREVTVDTSFGLCAIRAITWLADGSAFRTAGSEGVVRLWSPAGEARGDYRIPDDPTTMNSSYRALALSPDGKKLAGGRNKGVEISEQTGAITSRITQLEINHVDPTSVQFSTDGKRLAACGGMRLNIKVYDAATGKEVFDLTHGGIWSNPETVAFSPDGRAVVVGGGNRTKTGFIQVFAIDTD